MVLLPKLSNTELSLPSDTGCNTSRQQSSDQAHSLLPPTKRKGCLIMAVEFDLNQNERDALLRHFQSFRPDCGRTKAPPPSAAILTKSENQRDLTPHFNLVKQTFNHQTAPAGHHCVGCCTTRSDLSALIKECCSPHQDFNQER